ncbi:ribosomal protein S18-alanine N-acetyltransferase [Microbacterium sp.]|uniref:ribosomal protein S18-alanine N-acetyltransferase n=1 Tax=Microbacterium sp. TaxID=51671 RepID=UPI002811E964|nr:ribosomal protein S18-alanine N-acetyltransferase [Microbacterium sp.]
MTLRTATVDDLPAIMDLERRSFPTDAWSDETMGTEVTSAHNLYLVDEVDGRIVGYGGLRALQGGADADIQTIALDEAFRGRGRGRMLLRALISEAVARGAKELFLEVRADNPVAEGLYVSEGFAELGRRPRYYQPDDVDAVVMRLDLRAWSAETSHDSPENARNAGEDPQIDPAERAISVESSDREASA